MEHPKSKSTQLRSQTRWDTLYLSSLQLEEWIHEVFHIFTFRGVDWLQIRLWQLFHEGRDDTIEGHRGGPKETATPRARRLHVTMNGQTDGLRSAGMIKKASRALGCATPRPGFLGPRGEFTHPRAHLFYHPRSLSRMPFFIRFRAMAKRDSYYQSSSSAN